MKRTTKVLALVLILSLILSLAACGGGNKLDIKGDKIILAGKEYTVPFTTADLIDNGWKSDSSRSVTFSPQTRTSGGEVKITNDSGDTIVLISYYNDSDEDKDVNDCKVVKFDVDFRTVSDKKSYEFPGGITPESSRDDIIKAYGEPNDSNTEFDLAKEQSKLLMYLNQKDSGISYSFSFNDDDTLKAIEIESNTE